MLSKSFCLFKIPFFVALCLSFLEIATAQSKKLDPAEVAALKVIGEKLNNTKWNFSVDPCEAARSNSSGWAEPTPTMQNKTQIVNNLTCNCSIINSNSCHVISIMLKAQNLNGVLPMEFANLTHLRIVDLSRNYLNGTIPKDWAKLPLFNLSLLANRISGTIPDELKNITTLQELVLEANQLHGPIPQGLGNLKNLKRLLLSSNSLTGELPKTLGNLRNLQEFRIDDTSISGRIPSFIGNWTKLQNLYLQGTSLEGPLPASIVNLKDITELYVSDWIRGDGKFPLLQNMTKMKYLTLRNLSISGQIPGYLSNMQDLKSLDLSFNNFTGQIPANFSRRKLQYIFLTNNALNGQIAKWASAQVDLSYNTFTDTSSAPDECGGGSMNYVASYSSSDNNSIANCLRKNFPCSEKPKNYNFFINCGGKSVMIGEYEYEGDSSMEGTSAFRVSDSRKWAYTSTGFFLGNEKASHIAETSTILNMTNADLYKTARLSPNTLRYYGLCLQNGNYTVKLHFAEIVFRSDQTYFSLGQRYFDVSIQGQKILQEFNIARAANGTGKEFIKEVSANVTSNTLEIHFEWTGKGTQSIPERSSYGPLISAISVTPNFKPATDDKKLGTGAILGIIASIAILLLIVGLIGMYIWRKNLEDSELKSLILPTGRFSLKQIKAATGNFDQANKIGEGGFGPVYKGVLPDGSLIAAKQLSSKSRQGNREFINEVGMISALEHPNLVKLYGCCTEGSQLLLVYEYMENNSLARALFGNESTQKLDWQTRRKICIEIARGLTYLHEESSIKIVHRDIKATNILLDKDMTAKISDFGLAKLDEEEYTHISTRIAGTVGYMAPEYATRGYLTDKADVYSFGVVMLEIVSGTSNTSYKPRESLYLLDQALVLQEQGNLLELVDPALGSKYSEEEALQMLRLSLICTNISPTLRPKMSSVVSMLEGKSPVQVPSVTETPAEFQEMTFKDLQGVSHDSQPQSTSAEGPSFASSSSLSSQNHSNKGKVEVELETSKLLSEITD